MWGRPKGRPLLFVRVSVERESRSEAARQAETKMAAPIRRTGAAMSLAANEQRGALCVRYCFTVGVAGAGAPIGRVAGAWLLTGRGAA